MNQHLNDLVKAPASWSYNEDGTKQIKTIRTGKWNLIFKDKSPKGNQFIIRTGKKFDLIVIDVDIKHGNDGSDTLYKYDIVMEEYPTLTFKTPSGGYHYFYKWRTGLYGTNFIPHVDMIDNKPKDGIDNGWFVFHDTEKYICENDIPIAEIPDDLYNLLLEAKIKHNNEKTPKTIETKKEDVIDDEKLKNLESYYEFYINIYKKYEEEDEEGYSLSDKGKRALKNLNDEFVKITLIPIEEALNYVAKKKSENKPIIKSTTALNQKYYDLLNLLDDDWFKSYDKWAEPAYALYNQTDIEKCKAFNTFNALLKNRSGDKYDEEGAKILWNNSIPEAQAKLTSEGKALITMAKFKKIIGGSKNSLYKEWKNKYEPEIVKPKAKSRATLKEEEEELYEELVDKLSDAINSHGRCMIYDENEYSFSDIIRLHKSNISIEDLALLINRTFVCMLQRGGLYLIIKEIIVARCKFTKTYKANTSFDKFDFNKNFDKNIKPNIFIDNDTIITVPLKKLIFDISTSIPNYDSMGFFPIGPHNKSEPPSKIFNIFSGFLHKYKKDYVPNKNVVDTFCSMYKEILCNNNEKSFEFEINKLAHIIQYPEIKTESVSIFQGEQGTGKSFLMTFLMMYVFGKNLSLIIFQPEQLTNKFNSHLMGKLFIILEEAVDLGNLKDISKFKGYIRAPVLNVEFKNMNVSESVDCSMNFMIATNNSYNTMFREAGERTANLNKVNDKYHRNTKFFKEMSDILNNFEAGCDIFHFLANKDLSDFNIKDVPETDEKFNKKLESANTFFKFLYRLYMDDVDNQLTRDDEDYEYNIIDLNRDVSGDNGYLKIMEIYNAYMKMCDKEFSLPKGSKGVFSKDSVKIICEEIFDIIEPKKGRKEYLITKDSVAKVLNKHFKTNYFK